MLKIRLSRIGKKHEPHYRIIVTETRSKRDGRIVAQIGHYHPITKQLEVNKESYSNWIGKGAAPSLTVRKLVS